MKYKHFKQALLFKVDSSIKHKTQEYVELREIY